MIAPFVDCKCGMARIRRGVAMCSTCEVAQREGDRAAKAEDELAAARAEIARLRAELVNRVMRVSGDLVVCKSCRSERWWTGREPNWPDRASVHEHRRGCVLHAGQAVQP